CHRLETGAPAAACCTPFGIILIVRHCRHRLSRSEIIFRPSLTLPGDRSQSLRPGKHDRYSRGPREPLSEDESLPERVAGVEVELVAAGDMRRAADLRDDSIVWAERRALHGLHRHGTAENAFDRDALIQVQFAFGVMQRRPCADAGARWRTIELS